MTVQVVWQDKLCGGPVLGATLHAVHEDGHSPSTFAVVATTATGTVVRLFDPHTGREHQTRDLAPMVANGILAVGPHSNVVIVIADDLTCVRSFFRSCSHIYTTLTFAPTTHIDNAHAFDVQS